MSIQLCIQFPEIAHGLILLTRGPEGEISWAMQWQIETVVNGPTLESPWWPDNAIDIVSVTVSMFLSAFHSTPFPSLDVSIIMQFSIPSEIWLPNLLLYWIFDSNNAASMGATESEPWRLASEIIVIGRFLSINSETAVLVECSIGENSSAEIRSRTTHLSRGGYKSLLSLFDH